MSSKVRQPVCKPGALICVQSVYKGNTRQDECGKGGRDQCDNRNENPSDQPASAQKDSIVNTVYQKHCDNSRHNTDDMSSGNIIKHISRYRSQIHVSCDKILDHLCVCETADIFVRSMLHESCISLIRLLVILFVLHLLYKIFPLLFAIFYHLQI